MILYMLIFLQTGTGSKVPFIYFLIPMLLVWFFFMIYPQSKARKAQSNFLENLSKGDEVITDGGIIGRINKIEDEIVTIQLEGKIFMRIMRNNLSSTKTAAFNKA